MPEGLAVSQASGGLGQARAGPRALQGLRARDLVAEAGHELSLLDSVMTRLVRGVPKHDRAAQRAGASSCARVLVCVASARGYVLAASIVTGPESFAARVDAEKRGGGRSSGG